MPDTKINLISVPQLSDDGCICQLHKTKAIVTCGDTTVISDRDEETGLWTIPIEMKNEKENTKGDADLIVPMNKITTTITELENSKQTRMNKTHNWSSWNRRKKVLQLANKTTNIIN